MERIKIVILFFFISFFSVFAQNENVTFPFFLTLQDGETVPKGLYLPGSPSGENAATFKKEGLFLTPNNTRKFGAILMKDMSFSSSNGIEVSFEFNVYGGTGTDGFIMFLYDGSIPDEKMFMGAGARSMGYVFNRSTNSNEEKQRRKGLPGAYLGVALNISGNHKGRVFNDELRMNGISKNDWYNDGDFTGGSHITLRGAEYKMPIGDPMEGYRGYPVLKTVSTLFTKKESNGSAELINSDVVNDGDYSFGPGISEKDSFMLRNEGIADDENDEKFRKAFISLIPHKDGGFSITVQIQHGDKISTIINRYHYKTKVTYWENAEALYGDFETDPALAKLSGKSEKFELDASVPKRFKVGFAGITGGRKDIHMIRNLLISVPYAAVATDKNFVVCSKTMSEFYPFENDYAYAGHISEPKSSDKNIDRETFKFYPIEGGELIDNHHYSDKSGLWSYDPNTALIRFHPNDNFVNDGAIVRYSMKGKSGKEGEPYGEEIYRSNPASITLAPEECPVYVNPNLRIRNY